MAKTKCWETIMGARGAKGPSAYNRIKSDVVAPKANEPRIPKTATKAVFPEEHAPSLCGFPLFVHQGKVNERRKGESVTRPYGGLPSMAQEHEPRYRQPGRLGQSHVPRSWPGIGTWRGPQKSNCGRSLASPYRSATRQHDGRLAGGPHHDCPAPPADPRFPMTPWWSLSIRRQAGRS